MPVEQPLPRFRIRVAARRQRRVLMRSSPSGALTLLPLLSSWLCQFGRVFELLL